jgi:predicted transcriptional regulator of viral defense system
MCDKDVLTCLPVCSFLKGNYSVRVLSAYSTAKSAFLSISELFECCYITFSSAIYAMNIYLPHFLIP